MQHNLSLASQSTKIQMFFESATKTLEEMIDFFTKRKRAGIESRMTDGNNKGLKIMSCLIQEGCQTLS